MARRNEGRFSIMDEISPQGFAAGSEEIAGATQTLAELRQDEHEKILQLLDTYYYTNANPSVKDLVVENEDMITNLVRVVKQEVNQSFAGGLARGQALTLVDLEAEQFTNVYGASATSWENNIAGTGAFDYIGTSASAESVSEEEGYLIFGFIEKVPTPKVNKVMPQKNSETYPYSGLSWKSDEDVLLAPLPEPYFFPPESTFYIQGKANKTGDIELIPLGVKVMRGKNLLTL